MRALLAALEREPAARAYVFRRPDGEDGADYHQLRAAGGGPGAVVRSYTAPASVYYASDEAGPGVFYVVANDSIYAVREGAAQVDLETQQPGDRVLLVHENPRRNEELPAARARAATSPETRVPEERVLDVDMPWYVTTRGLYRVVEGTGACVDPSRRVYGADTRFWRAPSGALYLGRGEDALVCLRSVQAIAAGKDSSDYLCTTLSRVFDW